MNYQVRPARLEDAEALYGLMVELAVFERYVDRLAITVEDVIDAGFRKSMPDFAAIVAEDAESGALIGMAITYVITYTYAARPILVVKELYVAGEARNLGVGTALMAEVARLAVRMNCLAVRWQVAPWNDGGRRFYERLGATEDREWVNYALQGEALEQLAMLSESDRLSS